MDKIESKAAPKAVGPYSQGISVEAGRLIFLSGQIGLDVLSGQLVPGGVESQTEKVFDHIEAILKEAGLTLKNVVRMEVFLIDMGDFEKMNGVYAKRFGANIHPARYTVGVSKLPKGASVEIAAIASSKGSRG